MTRKLSCLSTFHLRHPLLVRRYAHWGLLQGWMLVRLEYQDVRHKPAPSILGWVMGEVSVGIVVMWHIISVCATFGHKSDAQQNSCNLYSLGDGGLLRAAYVRVLTSYHASLFGVADLSNISYDGGFKCGTTIFSSSAKQNSSAGLWQQCSNDSVIC